MADSLFGSIYSRISLIDEARRIASKKVSLPPPSSPGASTEIREFTPAKINGAKWKRKAFRADPPSSPP